MTWRGRLLRTLVGLLIVAAFAAVVLWRMTHVAPVWYDPPPPDDPKSAALAEEVEYRLIEQAQQVRSGEPVPWTRRIREAQINAWLATRLRAWVEHQRGGRWPDALGVPQARLRADSISIAVPVSQGGAQRTFELRVTPVLADDGLRLRLVGLSVGRVGLPGDPVALLAEWVSDLAPDVTSGPDFVRVIDVLAGRQAIPPTFELADGRMLRVRKLETNDGSVDVTIETLDGR